MNQFPKIISPIGRASAGTVNSAPLAKEPISRTDPLEDSQSSPTSSIQVHVKLTAVPLSWSSSIESDAFKYRVWADDAQGNRLSLLHCISYIVRRPLGPRDRSRDNDPTYFETFEARVSSKRNRVYMYQRNINTCVHHLNTRRMVTAVCCNRSKRPDVG